MGTEDKSPKARESWACCHNGVAQAQSMRWRATQITKGTRGDAKRLALHLEGSEKPLEGWDGHARACRGFQKITLEAVQRTNSEAMEEVT